MKEKAICYAVSVISGPSVTSQALPTQYSTHLHKAKRPSHVQINTRSDFQLIFHSNLNRQASINAKAV